MNLPSRARMTPLWHQLQLKFWRRRQLCRLSFWQQRRQPQRHRRRRQNGRWAGKKICRICTLSITSCTSTVRRRPQPDFFKLVKL